MEQISRLSIIHRLLSHSRYPVPKSKLLEALECSESTFKRLLRKINDEFDASILYDREHKGYIYDPSCPQLTLPYLNFSDKEWFALLTAEKLFTDLHTGSLSKELEGIKHVLQKTKNQVEDLGIANKIEILSAIISINHTDVFNQITTALWSELSINVEYQDSQQNTTQRTLSPQKVFLYKDAWYLLAWCHLRNQIRIFSLNRLVSAQDSNVVFHRLPEEQIQAYLKKSYGLMVGSTQHQAIIRFDQAVAPWVLDHTWHSDQKIETLATGELTLSFSFSDHRELVREIMRFQPNVTVISPVFLKEAVAQCLLKAVERMQK
ncbi:helix-turn-helix transcriptional regulator [Aliivibrio kagoshimensis]|uniref:helix-turn-helix transcriptional regulator n=1 Tax=Aliivibrio kagoshimensis TaxID=2910230 RepID=UPI003D14DD57